jgi:hypothetical protein
MNTKAYDITNIIAVALIAAGSYQYYGAPVAMIVTGALGLTLNMITLFVAVRVK